MSDLFKRRRFLSVAGIHVLVFIVLVVLLGAAGGRDVEKQARDTQGEVERIYAAGSEERPPDEASVERAAEAAKSLGSAVEVCERRIDYRVDPSRELEKVPDGNALASAILEAKNRLTSIDTGGRRIPLPDGNLGFGSDVPDPSKDREALVQLDVIVRVLSMALRAGVNSIESIDRNVSVPRDESGYLVETPVQFDLRGSPRALAQFLQSVASSEPFLSVREAHFTSREERDEVELVVVLSAIQVSRDAAVTEKMGGSARAAGSGAQPANEFDELFRKR